MQELIKLNNNYKVTRWLTIVSLLIMGTMAIISTILSFTYSKEFSKRIYVVNKNEQFQALAGDVKQNRPVEIEYHVSRFHEIFFGLAPDPKQIEGNMKKVSYLADESASRLYSDLKEQNYYNDLIQGNVIQSVMIDSVQVNTSNYPYLAVCYFKIIQNRATSKTINKLISSCTLEDIPRSIGSPNGLFLRNFKITSTSNKNQDVQSEEE
jgi:conjugative transposon TraK protein